MLLVCQSNQNHDLGGGGGGGVFGSNHERHCATCPQQAKGWVSLSRGGGPARDSAAPQRNGTGSPYFGVDPGKKGIDFLGISTINGTQNQKKRVKV